MNYEVAPQVVFRCVVVILWGCYSYTLRSGEDSLKLMELMAYCTKLSAFVRKKNREIHLKLEDAEGISSLSNEEIFEQLAHMGYVTNSESLTFFKGHFPTQWKFFIHTIIHCMSSKKTAWDQFSSNIATSIICLATNMRFNFSKFIFEAMVKNLDSPHKFLFYLRFIQLLLNKQKRLLLPHTRNYPTPTLTSKLFSNMRRASKGYSGVVTPLFESMLVQVQDEEQHQSPSRITSSPSLSQQPTQSSPSPEPLQPTYKAEETASMPHDSPLHVVHSHKSDKGSVPQHDLTVLVRKLHDRIDGLERDLQQTKKTYSTTLTKRKISQIDKDPTISLVQDEGISVHEKPSDETEVFIQEETPTEIIKEHRSGEKGEIDISTASPPKVSTAEAHVYTRRSAKDKGNAIMEEPVTLKKVRKRNQVQLRMDEELARKMEEEERIRFNAEQEARALQEEEEERLNLDASLELQRQLDQRQQEPAEATQSKVIDRNDPRSEVEEHSSKPRERKASKTVEEEKVEEEDVKPNPVLIEKKAVRIRRKTLARRRASDKQSEGSSKRQKKEEEPADYEEEKEELRMWLTVVPHEEEFVDPELMHTRFPIVDWESQSLYSIHVYKIIRANGNTSYHKTFEKKKYPLTKETLQKMLNWKLEAEAESSMAFKLLKFIKTQIQEQ
ncbi:hypothetical protein Tco_0851247 [Tanacetum coccineum]